MANSNTSFNSVTQQVEDQLDLYLVKKAPALPENIKELIVNILPWLTLVFGALAAITLLPLIGFGAVLAPLAFLGGASAGVSNILVLVTTAISVVLELLAIPGLFAKSKKGWQLVFYSTLVSLIGSILSLNIVGGIIGTLISLYFLFQVKSYYK